MPQKYQYKNGLVVGRFQPFHKGHAFLLEKAFQTCEFVTIGIGSSNVTDQNNPYDSSIVQDALSEFLMQSDYVDRSKVVCIEDVPDDPEWLEIVLRKVGDFDVALGDNEWVNGIFEKAGRKVIRIGFQNRNLLEGYKIRKLIREGKKWQDRVPPYVAELIREIPI